MPAAEHVERQVAVAVVIAVKEPAFLVAVQRVVGRVEVEHDLARRFLMGVEKQLDEQPLDRRSIVVDLVIARRPFVWPGACSRRFSVLLLASGEGPRPSRSNGLFPISGRPAMSVLSDITRSRGSLKPSLQDVASREADILEDGSRPQSLVQNSACRAERGIAGRKSCETSPALTEPNRPRLAQARHHSSAQVSHLGTR